MSIFKDTEAYRTMVSTLDKLFDYDLQKTFDKLPGRFPIDKASMTLLYWEAAFEVVEQKRFEAAKAALVEGVNS